MKMLPLIGVLLGISLLSSVCGASSAYLNEKKNRAFTIIVCNDTNVVDDSAKIKLQSAVTTTCLPIFYLVAFIVGLPSNLLALWVLVFRTKWLPSTVLLINLTVADCLLLLVLPFRIRYHFRGNDWDLGEPFCRVVMAMFYGNMYGSVLCLAFVALDRYIALVHPFGAKTLRSKQISLCMTVGVWVVMLAAMLPLLMSHQTYKLDGLNITTCHDALPQKEQQNYFLPYFATLFVSCFLLPFIVVLFCHSAVLHTLKAEGERYGRAVRVTVLVLLVFIVCVLPSNILLLIHYSTNRDDLYVPYMFSLTFSTFNSCIDPFIFYYVSAEFREKARIALCCSRKSGFTQSTQRTNVSYSSSDSVQRSKVTLLKPNLQKTSEGV